MGLLRAELILVVRTVLMLLQYLQVVNFFHHWLPEPHPSIDEPV